MDEKNCMWTDFKCEECNHWLLYDLSHNVYYCEKCGLVKEETGLKFVRPNDHKPRLC